MRGLVKDLDDSVRRYALDDGFDSPQNRAISWRHLLQQTSEWQGTLWSKPDSIDHNRDVGKSELGYAEKGRPRPPRPPGTLWEYNDVRVNRLALSLLQVFRRPLPDVLHEAVMEPLGASSSWEWQPYGNSWVEIDGVRMPSVPGGSHWGGGLWMSTRDHARFGLLIHRGGQWKGRELLARAWIEEMRRPCPLNAEYGLLWWLNTGHRQPRLHRPRARPRRRRPLDRQDERGRLCEARPRQRRALSRDAYCSTNPLPASASRTRSGAGRQTAPCSRSNSSIRVLSVLSPTWSAQNIGPPRYTGQPYP
jgi:CubicO group peptidase (beta-lactamase class C family)